MVAVEGGPVAAEADGLSKEIAARIPSEKLTRPVGATSVRMTSSHKGVEASGRAFRSGDGRCRGAVRFRGGGVAGLSVPAIVRCLVRREFVDPLNQRPRVYGIARVTRVRC
jgi:hypothetical protein